MARRLALVPFRWDGHGLDLRTKVAATGLLVHAQDLCTALEIDVPVESDPKSGALLARYPGLPIALAGYVDDDGMPVAFYTAEQTRTVARDNPSHLTAGFLMWFDELTDQLDTATVEAIIADVVHRPSPHADTNYSVARAASILSRDPALDYGQTALFETMRRALGWLDRVDGIWQPRPEPLETGWLFKQHTAVPGRRSLYPQVRVTKAGLLELHKRLGGIATLTLDDTPAPTLLEI